MIQMYMWRPMEEPNPSGAMAGNLVRISLDTSNVSEDLLLRNGMEQLNNTMELRDLLNTWNRAFTPRSRRGSCLLTGLNWFSHADVRGSFHVLEGATHISPPKCPDSLLGPSTRELHMIHSVATNPRCFIRQCKTPTQGRFVGIPCEPECILTLWTLCFIAFSPPMIKTATITSTTDI